MARTRNIKPAFFKHEGLAELPPETRLLFIGLWCIADRDGRLEDRPKRIKTDTLPYDDYDIDSMLQALHDGGYIKRYEVDGKRYILIPNFTKYQHIVNTEKGSDIPPAPGEDDTSAKNNQTSTKKNLTCLKKNQTSLADVLHESRILNLESCNTTTRENSEEEWCEIAKAFSDNIHPISGEIENDMLHDLYTEYGKTWMLACIEEGVASSQGPPNLKYLQRILERWKRDGFKAKKKPHTANDTTRQNAEALFKQYEKGIG